MGIKSNFVKVKGYTQFIKEEFGELFKALLVYDNTNKGTDISYKEYATENFMLPLTEKKLSYQINQKYPVINYNNDISRYLIENKLIPLENVYNKPDDVKSVSSKRNFHMTMEKSKFVPKTVFSKEDALENLSFPIIAKPDNNHSGIGIQSFKLKEELRENKDEFEVFSEKIKIDEEFRLILFKEHPLLFMKREALNKKAKEGTGGTDEAMKFGYTKVVLDYIPDEFKEILKEVRENFSKVDIYALDLMKDEDGAMYIIEINSQPGLPYDASVKLYHSIYNDFYDKEMSEDTMHRLGNFASDLDMKTIQNTNNRFIIGT